MPASARRPQLFLRAVAATAACRTNARWTLRSGPPIRRWSRGPSMPDGPSTIVRPSRRPPFDLPLFLHLVLNPIIESLCSPARDPPLAVTLSGSELSGRLCQCRVPADYVIRKGKRQRDRGEKSGGRDGRRGIAGFGRLDSRAGFTVSRETRTPGLD